MAIRPLKIELKINLNLAELKKSLKQADPVLSAFTDNFIGSFGKAVIETNKTIDAFGDNFRAEVGKMAFSAQVAAKSISDSMGGLKFTSNIVDPAVQAAQSFDVMGDAVDGAGKEVRKFISANIPELLREIKDLNSHIDFDEYAEASNSIQNLKDITTEFHPAKKAIIKDIKEEKLVWAALGAVINDTISGVGGGVATLKEIQDGLKRQQQSFRGLMFEINDFNPEFEFKKEEGKTDPSFGIDTGAIKKILENQRALFNDFFKSMLKDNKKFFKQLLDQTVILAKTVTDARLRVDLKQLDNQKEIEIESIKAAKKAASEKSRVIIERLRLENQRIKDAARATKTASAATTQAAKKIDDAFDKISLDDLKSELQFILSTIKTSPAIFAKMAASIDELNSKPDSKQFEKLKRSILALDEGRKAVNKLDEDLKDLRKTTKLNLSTNQKYSDFLRNNLSQALKFNAQAIKTIRSEYNSWSRAFTFIRDQTRLLISALRNVTDVGVSFSDTMAEARAALSITSDEFDRLNSFARETAKTLPQTATQVAEGITILAKRGASLGIIEDSLRDIILLAGSGFDNVAKSAEAVDSAIKIFGVTVLDAATVGNVFARSMDTSASNASDLAGVLKSSKGAFVSYKATIQEVVAATGLLANSAIRGSVTGTSLRESFKRLSIAGEPVVDGLTKLGLSVSDVDPRFKSLSQIIGAFADSGKSAEETTGALNKIFGRHSGVIDILVQNYGDYSASVLDLNAANELTAEGITLLEQRFKIQQDTLGGSIRLFNSAAEEFRLTIFDGVEPALRVLVDTATSMLNIFTENRSIVEIISAAFNDFIGLLDRMANKIKDNQELLFNLSKSIHLVIASITVLVSFIADKAITIFKGLSQALTIISGVFLAFAATVKTAFNAIVDGFNVVFEMGKGFSDFVSDILSGDILGAFAKLFDNDEIQTSIANFQQNAGDGLKEIADTATATTEVLADLFNGVVEQSATTQAAFVGLSGTVKQLQSDFAKLFEPSKEGIEGNIERIQAWIAFLEDRQAQEKLSVVENKAIITELQRANEALQLINTEYAKVTAAQEESVKQIASARKQVDNLILSLQKVRLPELGKIDIEVEQKLRQAKIDVAFDIDTGKIDDLADAINEGLSLEKIILGFAVPEGQAERFKELITELQTFRAQKVAEVDNDILTKSLDAQVQFKRDVSQLDAEFRQLRIQQIDQTLSQETELNAAQVEALRQVRIDALDSEIAETEGKRIESARVQAEETRAIWEENNQFLISSADLMASHFSSVLTSFSDFSITAGERVQKIIKSMTSAVLGLLSKTLAEMIKNAIIQQAFSIGQQVAAVGAAVITGKALAKAYATSAALASVASFGAAAAAGSLALGATLGSAHSAALAGPGFAGGAVDIQGPGTGTSDSITARISKGESVTTAKATKETKPILQFIRESSLPTLRNFTNIVTKNNIFQAARSGLQGLPNLRDGVTDFLSQPSISDLSFAIPGAASFAGNDISVAGIESRLDTINRTVAENKSSFVQVLNSIDIQETSQDQVLNTLQDFSDRGIIEGVTVNV